jgi:ATP-binding cassette subfamily C protein CydC
VAGYVLVPQYLALLALFALASFEAVTPLPLAMQTLGESLAAARRIFSLADSLPAVIEPAEPLTIPECFAYRFQNVSFRYRPDSPDVLHGISFQLTPGRKLAVVGATGCGKSTLASLLLRFREPTGGSLLLNERPLQHYSGEALREQIAALSQQTHLFNTTIRDNLLLACPGADRVAIEQACETVLIHDFIAAQPDGYDTLTGETGVRLSGGQARRVAIARALLKNAPLLILDEPTEGVDPGTARKLMANILARVEDRRQSLLLITHQLQGLEYMDEVLVVEQGRVIESGSHQQLMDARGHYWRLCMMK